MGGIAVACSLALYLASLAWADDQSPHPVHSGVELRSPFAQLSGGGIAFCQPFAYGIRRHLPALERQ